MTGDATAEVPLGSTFASATVSVPSYGSLMISTTAMESCDKENPLHHGDLPNPRNVSHVNHFPSAASVSASEEAQSLLLTEPSSPSSSSSPSLDPHLPPPPQEEVEEEEGEADGTSQKMTWRRFAIDISLYFNLFILLSKALAYLHTLSLSVLAALTDSLLDVISQIVLYYTERTSSMSRSSAFYPAGASRLEPIGVLICAALMGMASFEILKQSIQALLSPATSSLDETLEWEGGSSSSSSTSYSTSSTSSSSHSHMFSIYGMISIVLAKFLLYILCDRARPDVYKKRRNGQFVIQKASDPTLEALALDHWNDAWSNAVAAAALLCIRMSQHLWFVDPLGAIAISIYIIYNWFETGREQIEHLTGKAAPDEFIDELHELVNSFDSTGRYRIITDVVRAYHFGPKFLVEVEIVLPKDTLLMDSHDIGMELQYEIEGRDEVERCFVHIDYEQRPYDEHVVSKVPELRERYRPSASGNHSFGSSSIHSV